MNIRFGQVRETGGVKLVVLSRPSRDEVVVGRLTEDRCVYPSETYRALLVRSWPVVGRVKLHALDDRTYYID